MYLGWDRNNGDIIFLRRAVGRRGHLPYMYIVLVSINEYSGVIPSTCHCVLVPLAAPVPSQKVRRKWGIFLIDKNDISLCKLYFNTFQF